MYCSLRHTVVRLTNTHDLPGNDRFCPKLHGLPRSLWISGLKKKLSILPTARQSVHSILGLPVVRVKSLAMQRSWASCGSASSATDSKLAVKRNKLLIYATTYINRKYIVFSERNQTQKLCSVGIDNHISPGHIFQSQHRGIKGTLSVIAFLFFLLTRIFFSLCIS